MLRRQLRRRNDMSSELSWVLDASVVRMADQTSLERAIAALGQQGALGSLLAKDAQDRLFSPSAARTTEEPLAAEVVDRVLNAHRRDGDMRQSLRAVSLQLRVERLQWLRAQTNRIPVVAAVPFLVCVLPATLLFLVL